MRPESGARAGPRKPAWDCDRCFKLCSRTFLTPSAVPVPRESCRCIWWPFCPHPRHFLPPGTQPGCRRWVCSRAGAPFVSSVNFPSGLRNECVNTQLKHGGDAGVQKAWEQAGVRRAPGSCWGEGAGRDAVRGHHPSVPAAPPTRTRPPPRGTAFSGHTPRDSSQSRGAPPPASRLRVPRAQNLSPVIASRNVFAPNQFHASVRTPPRTGGADLPAAEPPACGTCARTSGTRAALGVRGPSARARRVHVEPRACGLQGGRVPSPRPRGALTGGDAAASGARVLGPLTGCPWSSARLPRIARGRGRSPRLPHGDAAAPCCHQRVPAAGGLAPAKERICRRL